MAAPLPICPSWKRCSWSKSRRLPAAWRKKLLTYATGATITFGDRPAVAGIVQSAAARDYGLRSLVHAVVESPAFLSK